MNVLVFDIETIPDVDAGRRILHLDQAMTDAEVAAHMLAKRKEEKGNEFLPIHLHQIAAISVVFQFNDKFKVCSIGDEKSSEIHIVQKFFEAIDKYTPVLISWNGGGFDLPVLHYRALKHKIAAPRYWESGDNDSSFKWNNYLSKYHQRHTDVMDVLASYQTKCYAPLDEVASMLGFPGKMGMHGGKVWEAYQAGQLKAIRDYCETDVLNTYLVYLRYELMRGNLNLSEYDSLCQNLRQYLQQENKPHFTEFLAAWQEN
jgi:predicted PolB exonuclease-like 3'-5' exonuclease